MSLFYIFIFLVIIGLTIFIIYFNHDRFITLKPFYLSLLTSLLLVIAYKYPFSVLLNCLGLISLYFLISLMCIIFSVFIVKSYKNEIPGFLDFILPISTYLVVYSIYLAATYFGIDFNEFFVCYFTTIFNSLYLGFDLLSDKPFWKYSLDDYRDALRNAFNFNNKQTMNLSSDGGNELSKGTTLFMDGNENKDKKDEGKRPATFSPTEEESSRSEIKWNDWLKEDVYSPVAEGALASEKENTVSEENTSGSEEENPSVVEDRLVSKEDNTVIEGSSFTVAFRTPTSAVPKEDNTVTEDSDAPKITLTKSDWLDIKKGLAEEGIYPVSEDLGFSPENTPASPRFKVSEADWLAIDKAIAEDRIKKTATEGSSVPSVEDRLVSKKDYPVAESSSVPIINTPVPRTQNVVNEDPLPSSSEVPKVRKEHNNKMIVDGVQLEGDALKKWTDERTARREDADYVEYSEGVRARRKIREEEQMKLWSTKKK